MSLLRLLTAGKSLIGLKNPARRYILSRPGALPKFNSKKNPFRLTACLQPAVPLQEPAAASASPTQTTASTSVGSANGNGTPRVAPIIARGSLPGDSRIRGLGSVLSWLRPKAPNPIAPRPTKSMVQCELSLDTVRVVRNDLSDSDLEIVLPKTPPAKPEPSLPQMTQTVSPESAWSRVNRQLFGAGTT